MTPPLRWPPVLRQDPWRCYELLLDSLPADPEPVVVHTGSIWTLARSGRGSGLVASPDLSRRGAGRAVPVAAGAPAELVGLIRSWQPAQAAVGLAAMNAMFDAAGEVAGSATPLDVANPGDNPVFGHFAAQAAGSRVVVVGRQPGLASLRAVADVTVIDAQPATGELPLAAADYLLPDADWVFLSAATLTDKTFPHLAALASAARLVLTGAATPWLPALREFGVDYLAGVRVRDPAAAEAVVSEGGGSRIYDGAVQHAVLDLAQDEAARLKSAIAAVFARRARLKADMEAWYAQGKRRFPGSQELLRIDADLARLDARYRQLWDAQQAAARASG